MTINSLLAISSLISVTAGSLSASGEYTIGSSNQKILVPTDANQVLVLKGALDASGVAYPSEIAVDLADGLVDSASYPIAPFVSADWDDLIGATGANADGAAAGFDTVYAIVLVSKTGIVVGNIPNGGSAWQTGPWSAITQSLQTQHLVLDDDSGWAVVAGNEMSLAAPAGIDAADFEIVIIGKKA